MEIYRTYNQSFISEEEKPILEMDVLVIGAEWFDG